MIPDIYGRAKVLSKTCLKIALVLPQDKALANLIRHHVVDQASSLAIKSKGLLITQNPEYFLKKLSEAKESSDGLHYWLELISEEGYLSTDIINPILEESTAISHLFALAIKKIKPN